MSRKQKVLSIGGGIAIFILLVGVGIFLVWTRSQQPAVEFQNEKQFEGESVANTEAAPVVPEDGLTEEKQSELVAAEKAETAKPTETAPKPARNDSEAKRSDSGGGFSIKSNLVSFGYESASGRDINTVVLHSSHAVNGDPYDVDDVIALWKSYGVAPHYMIARDGTVYQLVSDKNIAYHAGEGKMPDGRGGVNNFSIGVEILNTKTDKYTAAQYQATKDLIVYLEKKYGNMKVVGHDTIAPGRKSDPWNFDWDKI